jgi:hypothetical protein
MKHQTASTTVNSMPNSRSLREKTVDLTLDSDLPVFVRASHTRNSEHP